MGLEARNISYVKSIPLKIRAKVLYEFLKKGTSMRDIGKTISYTNQLDGWHCWYIIHFYGFNKNAKGFYTHITLKKLHEELEEISEMELEEFYLAEETLEDIMIAHYLHIIDSDNTNVFRNIRIRKEQKKLRKKQLANYDHCCALCNISSSTLLMTSYIKPWLELSPAEQMDCKNTMILCKIHDSLFQSGFISLTDTYEVIFSTEFDFIQQGLAVDLSFRYPKEDPPNLNLLMEHRKKHNLAISQGRFF